MSAEIKTANAAEKLPEQQPGRSPRDRRGSRKIGLLLYPEANAIQAQRPRTRGDCVDGPRPCPWVGCRHHLYLQIKSNGALCAQPVEPWDLRHSCSLDVAEEAEDLRLVDLAEALGVTHQNVSLALEDAVRSFKREAAKIIDPGADLADKPAPTLGRQTHGGAP